MLNMRSLSKSAPEHQKQSALAPKLPLVLIDFAPKMVHTHRMLPKLKQTFTRSWALNLLFSLQGHS